MVRESFKQGRRERVGDESMGRSCRNQEGMEISHYIPYIAPPQNTREVDMSCPTWPENADLETMDY